MFSANISGVIKRVVFDNEEEGKDAMIKISVEARKQYVKKDDMPNVYPLVTIWGNDAAYVREYAGKGHWIELLNCDLDVYRPDDAEEDRLSFKAGKVSLLPKALSEAVAETIEDEDEDDDEAPRRRKKKKSSKYSSKRGKSRSERRRPRDEEDDDFEDDDEEEEEAPRRKKKPTKKSSTSRKKAPSKKRKVEDDDDDYEDDYDDDEDDYFDDED